jgi:hypothetical protein
MDLNDGNGNNKRQVAPSSQDINSDDTLKQVRRTPSWSFQPKVVEGWRYPSNNSLESGDPSLNIKFADVKQNADAGADMNVAPASAGADADMNVVNAGAHANDVVTPVVTPGANAVANVVANTVANVNPLPNPGTDPNMLKAYYIDAGGGGGGGGGGVPGGVLVGDESFLEEDKIIDLLPNDEEEQLEISKEVEQNEEYIRNEILKKEGEECRNASSTNNNNTKQSAPSSSTVSCKPRTMDPTKATYMSCLEGHGNRFPKGKVNDILLSLLTNGYDLKYYQSYIKSIEETLECIYHYSSAHPGLSSISSRDPMKAGSRISKQKSITAIANIATKSGYKNGAKRTMAVFEYLANKYAEKYLKHSNATGYLENVSGATEEFARDIILKQKGEITASRETVHRDAFETWSFSAVPLEIYEYIEKIIQNKNSSALAKNLEPILSATLNSGDIFSCSMFGDCQFPRTSLRGAICVIGELGKPLIDTSDFSSFKNVENYTVLSEEDDDKDGWSYLIPFKRQAVAFFQKLRGVNPNTNFKQLVNQNVELLKTIAGEMVKKYNSIFNSDNFGVVFFEVYSNNTARGYTYSSNQILVTDPLFQTMIKAYKNTWGGDQGAKLDNQLTIDISNMIKSKIYSSSSLFIHLLNCMITDFFSKIITNFKNSNYIVDRIQLIQFQSKFKGLWTSSTLEIIEYSNTTNRGYFGNDACQVAPFENNSQIETGSNYEYETKTGTQEDMKKELNILKLKVNFNSSDHMSTIRYNTGAKYDSDDSDDSQDGGRMIRNKSSVCNRVTRKRKQQNKQNKQRRKTKRRITRRTTRKQRRQGKRRRTKKRN